jgi:uncharacterized membrane protein (DUF4010 family)
LLDTFTFDDAVRLAVALGIGLLIGAERERRMAERARRGPAGLRTFALVALLGGVVDHVGGDAVLAVALAFVAGAALVSYFREGDPGITTEVALVVTFLLGVLAQREPAVASALAVSVTILLATRSALHRFVSSVLTDQEVHDALLLAAAALVVLPLLPNRTVGPLEVLNPFSVWRLVVLLMAISSAGYVAVRAVGPRYGLPIAGLLGGFVSSTATIGAMGARSRGQPDALRATIAAALFSTVATMLQMAALVGTISSTLLRDLVWPLAFGAVAALVAAGIALLGARATPDEHRVGYGRAFELRTAVILAGTITAVTFASAAASEIAGDSGVQLAAFVGGFADTHAAAIGVSSVFVSGKLGVSAATLAVLAALSSNTVSKVVFAFIGGGSRYAVPVAIGLVIVIAAVWLGLLLPPV